MEKAIPEQLKEISHQYYRGFIDLGEYQAQRSALIDRFFLLINGNETVQMPAGQGVGVDFLFGQSSVDDSSAESRGATRTIHTDEVIVEDAMTGSVVGQLSVNSSITRVAAYDDGVAIQADSSLGRGRQNPVQDILAAADVLSQSAGDETAKRKSPISSKKSKGLGSKLLLIISVGMLTAAGYLFYLVAK